MTGSNWDWKSKFRSDTRSARTVTAVQKPFRKYPNIETANVMKAVFVAGMDRRESVKRELRRLKRFMADGRSNRHVARQCEKVQRAISAKAAS